MTATNKKYTKEQLLNSQMFAGKRDLLTAILEVGKTYNIETVEKMIEKYKKGVTK